MAQILELLRQPEDPSADHVTYAGQDVAGYASEPYCRPVSPEVGIFCHPHNHSAVRATQMSLEAYLDLRGWPKTDPSYELQAEGYLVEQPNIGPANAKISPFFIAWVAKNEFDAVYKKRKSKEFSLFLAVDRGKDNG